MYLLSWLVWILTAAFLASTKTTTAVKRLACKNGQLTLHYKAADRNVNAVQDVEWKIKFLGTGWFSFSFCSQKKFGDINCKNKAVLADGITFVSNSKNGAVTIERSRNATHDHAQIMCQVHYFDDSVSRRVYEVNFTAQCVRIQEGRDLNLTKILLMNLSPSECQRVVDIEWYDINGSRFAHCGSCQVCRNTTDSKHPVPVFWNRLQVRRGSLLLTGIQHSDNDLEIKVKIHFESPAAKSTKRDNIDKNMETAQVYRIWIFVKSPRSSPEPNSTPPFSIQPTSRMATRTGRSSLPSSSKGDVACIPFAVTKSSRSGASAMCTRVQLWTAVTIAATVYLHFNQR
ncbi:uncharacterized protein LOC144643276 [Oculina patagonica]